MVNQGQPGPNVFEPAVTDSSTTLLHLLFLRFDGEHWLGAFQQHLPGNAAEQQLAHRAALPDTDHQEFGVVVFHRLEQLLGGVDPDGLGEFELAPRTR